MGLALNTHKTHPYYELLAGDSVDCQKNTDLVKKKSRYFVPTPERRVNRRVLTSYSRPRHLRPSLDRTHRRQHTSGLVYVCSAAKSLHGTGVGWPDESTHSYMQVQSPSPFPDTAVSTTMMAGVPNEQGGTISHLCPNLSMTFGGPA